MVINIPPPTQKAVEGEFWTEPWYRALDDLASSVNLLEAGMTTVTAFPGFFYYVKDYGAIGDGVADDLAAIMDTMNAATAGGGGYVLFDAATYAISAPLTKKTNVILRGAGKFSTIIKPIGNTDGVNNTGASHYGFEHLQFDMSNTTDRTAIIARDQYWHVDHVYIKQMSRYGVDINFADYASITNCVMDRDVARTSLNSPVVSFTGNNATHILIKKNKFSKVGGMQLNGTNILVMGNEMSGHGYSACVFSEANDGSRDLIVAYNHFYDSNQSDDDDATVITATETWSRNTLILGNVIHGMWGAGIQIQAPDCQVIGNRCYNNCTKGVVSGAGQIELLSRGAAFPYAQPDNCMVAFNTVYDDNALAPYAYNEALIGGSAVANGVQLIGNNFRNGVTQTLRIQSPTTRLAMLVQAQTTATNPPVALASYTVATVPTVTPAGQQIYVSNESGGAVTAFSDGTNWRRVTDRAIVS
jgi:Pectate lyase superfamily protein